MEEQRDGWWASADAGAKGCPHLRWDAVGVVREGGVGVGEGIGEDGKDGVRGDKQSRLSSKLVVVRGVGLMVGGDTGGVCGGGGVVGAS